MSLTLLGLIGIGLPGVSAQVTDPANPRVHAVIGIITQASASSFRLRADNGERVLKVDKSTSVSRRRPSGTHQSLQNDGVAREHKFTDFVKVGDEALVTYRDDDGVLTALMIRIAPNTQTGR
jgi:hypothetical protein